ncbi:MAG: hypothetical protein JWO71_122 [Candidatus Acidoferrum typicum]|nr:hypothetical protein [Candidatus Acidoferrum typicum]
MTEITDWFQNNWIDLARLLVQGAILAAVVRYGRKLLATLRASQEQVGALLKLSVSDTVGEQPAPTPEPSRRYEAPSLNLREPEPEPQPEPEPEPVFAGGFSRDNYAGQREQSLGGRVMGAQAPAFSAPNPVFSTPVARAESPSLTPWVSAPAVEPERLSTPVPPIGGRAGVSSWLQTPMRSSGGSPWRKVVRWLQTPTGR